MSHEDYETEPVDPTLVTAADYETYVRPYIAALQAEVERLADQLQGAVEEIAAWLQHVDRLDEIPGARIGLPERNVLWDAAEAIRQHFGAVAR
jgi:hypothetical protein